MGHPERRQAEDHGTQGQAEPCPPVMPEHRTPCWGEKAPPQEEFWGGRPGTFTWARGQPSQMRPETFAPNAEKAGRHATGKERLGVFPRRPRLPPQPRSQLPQASSARLLTRLSQTTHCPGCSPPLPYGCTRWPAGTPSAYIPRSWVRSHTAPAMLGQPHLPEPALQEEGRQGAQGQGTATASHFLGALEFSEIQLHQLL